MTFLQEPPPGRKCNATVINPPGKKYTGRGVLHRGLDICLKTPFYLANRLWMRGERLWAIGLPMTQ